MLEHGQARASAHSPRAPVCKRPRAGAQSLTGGPGGPAGRGAPGVPSAIHSSKSCHRPKGGKQPARPAGSAGAAAAPTSPSPSAAASRRRLPAAPGYAAQPHRLTRLLTAGARSLDIVGTQVLRYPVSQRPGLPAARGCT